MPEIKKVRWAYIKGRRTELPNDQKELTELWVGDAERPGAEIKEMFPPEGTNLDLGEYTIFCLGLDEAKNPLPEIHDYIFVELIPPAGTGPAPTGETPPEGTTPPKGEQPGFTEVEIQIVEPSESEYSTDEIPLAVGILKGKNKINDFIWYAPEINKDKTERAIKKALQDRLFNVLGNVVGRGENPRSIKLLTQESDKKYAIICIAERNDGVAPAFDYKIIEINIGKNPNKLIKIVKPSPGSSYNLSENKIHLKAIINNKIKNAEVEWFLTTETDLDTLEKANYSYNQKLKFNTLLPEEENAEISKSTLLFEQNYNLVAILYEKDGQEPLDYDFIEIMNSETPDSEEEIKLELFCEDKINLDSEEEISWYVTKGNLLKIKNYLLRIRERKIIGEGELMYETYLNDKSISINFSKERGYDSKKYILEVIAYGLTGAPLAETNKIIQLKKSNEIVTNIKIISPGNYVKINELHDWEVKLKNLPSDSRIYWINQQGNYNEKTIKVMIKKFREKIKAGEISPGKSIENNKTISEKRLYTLICIVTNNKNELIDSAYKIYEGIEDEELPPLDKIVRILKPEHKNQVVEHSLGEELELLVKIDKEELNRINGDKGTEWFISTETTDKSPEKIGKKIIENLGAQESISLSKEIQEKIGQGLFRIGYAVFKIEENKGRLIDLDSFLIKLNDSEEDSPETNQEIKIKSISLSETEVDLTTAINGPENQITPLIVSAKIENREKAKKIRVDFIDENGERVDENGLNYLINNRSLKLDLFHNLSSEIIKKIKLIKKVKIRIKLTAINERYQPLLDKDENEIIGISEEIKLTYNPTEEDPEIIITKPSNNQEYYGVSEPLEIEIRNIQPNELAYWRIVYSTHSIHPLDRNKIKEEINLGEIFPLLKKTLSKKEPDEFEEIGISAVIKKENTEKIIKRKIKIKYHNQNDPETKTPTIKIITEEDPEIENEYPITLEVEDNPKIKKYKIWLIKEGKGKFLLKELETKNGRISYDTTYHKKITPGIYTLNVDAINDSDEIVIENNQGIMGSKKITLHGPSEQTPESIDPIITITTEPNPKLEKKYPITWKVEGDESKIQEYGVSLEKADGTILFLKALNGKSYLQKYSKEFQMTPGKWKILVEALDTNGKHLKNSKGGIIRGIQEIDLKESLEALPEIVVIKPATGEPYDISIPLKFRAINIKEEEIFEWKIGAIGAEIDPVEGKRIMGINLNDRFPALEQEINNTEGIYEVDIYLNYKSGEEVKEIEKTITVKLPEKLKTEIKIIAPWTNEDGIQTRELGPLNLKAKLIQGKIEKNDEVLWTIERYSPNASRGFIYSATSLFSGEMEHTIDIQKLVNSNLNAVKTILEEGKVSIVLRAKEKDTQRNIVSKPIHWKIEPPKIESINLSRTEINLYEAISNPTKKITPLIIRANVKNQALIHQIRTKLVKIDGTVADNNHLGLPFLKGAEKEVIGEMDVFEVLSDEIKAQLKENKEVKIQVLVQAIDSEGYFIYDEDKKIVQMRSEEIRLYNKPETLLLPEPAKIKIISPTPKKGESAINLRGNETLEAKVIKGNVESLSWYMVDTDFDTSSVISDEIPSRKKIFLRQTNKEDTKFKLNVENLELISGYLVCEGLNEESQVIAREFIPVTTEMRFEIEAPNEIDINHNTSLPIKIKILDEKPSYPINYHWKIYPKKDNSNTLMQGKEDKKEFTINLDKELISDLIEIKITAVIKTGELLLGKATKLIEIINRKIKQLTTVTPKGLLSAGQNIIKIRNGEEDILREEEYKLDLDRIKRRIKKSKEIIETYDSSINFAYKKLIEIKILKEEEIESWITEGKAAEDSNIKKLIDTLEDLENYIIETVHRLDNNPENLEMKKIIIESLRRQINKAYLFVSQFMGFQEKYLSKLNKILEENKLPIKSNPLTEGLDAHIEVINRKGNPIGKLRIWSPTEKVYLRARIENATDAPIIYNWEIHYEKPIEPKTPSIEERETIAIFVEEKTGETIEIDPLTENPSLHNLNLIEEGGIVTIHLTATQENTISFDEIEIGYSGKKIIGEPKIKIEFNRETNTAKAIVKGGSGKYTYNWLPGVEISIEGDPTKDTIKIRREKAGKIGYKAELMVDVTDTKSEQTISKKENILLKTLPGYELESTIEELENYTKYQEKYWKANKGEIDSLKEKIKETDIKKNEIKVFDELIRTEEVSLKQIRANLDKINDRIKRARKNNLLFNKETELESAFEFRAQIDRITKDRSNTRRIELIRKNIEKIERKRVKEELKLKETELKERNDNAKEILKERTVPEQKEFTETHSELTTQLEDTQKIYNSLQEYTNVRKIKENKLKKIGISVEKLEKHSINKSERILLESIQSKINLISLAINTIEQWSTQEKNRDYIKQKIWVRKALRNIRRITQTINTNYSLYVKETTKYETELKKLQIQGEKEIAKSAKDAEKELEKIKKSTNSYIDSIQKRVLKKIRELDFNINTTLSNFNQRTLSNEDPKIIEIKKAVNTKKINLNQLRKDIEEDYQEMNQLAGATITIKDRFTRQKAVIDLENTEKRIGLDIEAIQSILTWISKKTIEIIEEDYKRAESTKEKQNLLGDLRELLIISLREKSSIEIDLNKLNRRIKNLDSYNKKDLEKILQELKTTVIKNYEEEELKKLNIDLEDIYAKEGLNESKNIIQTLAEHTKIKKEIKELEQIIKTPQEFKPSQEFKSEITSNRNKINNLKKQLITKERATKNKTAKAKISQLIRDTDRKLRARTSDQEELNLTKRIISELEYEIERPIKEPLPKQSKKTITRRPQKKGRNSKR